MLEVLKPKVPVKRMVFHEITPHAIREALDNPRDLDMKLVEAQEGRRILDRLVGWETSPVLWRVFGRGQAASAGRVQSVAVRLVVERERARMAFRSGPVAATSKARSSRERRQPFRAALVELDGKRVAEGRDFDPATGQLARRRATSCSSTTTRADALADRLARRRRSRSRRSSREPFTERPRAPFTTSTLQQERAASSASARRARCAIAQRLYERGYITYMRTDSTNLSEQAITAARDRDPRAVRRRVPARRAARVPQQGEERAGGARGDPARRRSHPHPRRRARASSTATSSVSTS